MAKIQSADYTGEALASNNDRHGGASKFEYELEAMRLMGKRNLDAAWAINRLAVDCVQQCAERQTELWSKFSSNALGMVDMFLTQGGTSVPVIQGSPEVTDMIEMILDHMRALSETIARANQEALDVMSNRSEVCFREVEEAARRTLMSLIDSGTLPPTTTVSETGSPSNVSDRVSKG